MKKQAEQDEKLRKDVEAGRAIAVPYVPKENRKATPNTKCEFKTVEEEADACRE